MGSGPILFERWSGSLSDPRFDSEILEGQFRRSTYPQTRLRLRVALLYVLASSLAWTIYFSVAQGANSSPGMALGAFSLAVLAGGASAVTQTDFYKRRAVWVGAAAAAALCGATLLGFIGRGGERTCIGLTSLSSMAVQVLLLNYTVMPLPLYARVALNTAFSVAFEVLAALIGAGSGGGLVIVARVLLHICVHAMGLHVLVKSQVRMRGVFMKVGQSLLVRCQLEMEKHLKEKMIHSVMPPKVAEWLMSEAVADENTGTVGEDGERSECSFGLRKVSSPRSSNTAASLGNRASGGDDLRGLFRPFNMHRMESVSILFADIVGFTGMSSNKTAEQLVTLLSDLFGRFDVLCGRHGCEKISTLGDCYYCVSGCPEPRADHAVCCVELGLAMIGAIALFDQERKESVDMRVGVHTGTVLCGIVGTKRFKFDVWSNDVTLANRMESTGRPGKVHVSEKTLAFLQNQYYVQPAEQIQGLKTYFIIGRRSEMVTQALAVEPWLCPPSPLQQSPVRHHQCPAPTPMLLAQDDKKSSSLPSVFDPTKGEGVSIRDLEEMACKKPKVKRRDSRRKGLATLHRIKRASERRQPLLDRGANGVTNGDSFRSRSKTIGVKRASSGANLSQLSPGSLSLSHGSIQQQICAMNGVVPDHAGSRVSSYYTASHSTINDPASTNDVSPVATSGGSNNAAESSVPLNEKLAQSLQMRKQSDMQMIRCIQDDGSHTQYFVRPPLHLATLFFLDQATETEYRQYAHCYEEGEASTTLASPHLNTMVDVGLAGAAAIATSAAMLAAGPSVAFLAVFPVATLVSAAALYIVVRRPQLMQGKRSWPIRHICGGLIASLPSAVTLANWSCVDTATLGTAALASLASFCNFSQLSCWARLGLAAICGGATAGTAAILCGGQDGWQPWELCLGLALTLVLVGFLNREFEMGFRMGFHCARVAARDRRRVQNLKDQADWLLHNIIPRHVAERLKTEAKYSQNHRHVGILFASIVNFNEMYDETYQGGKEYLRVLNELIGDFDELLDSPRFRNVEKIKTIGSTFMAASGLNPQVRDQNDVPDAHLFEIVEFALEMQEVISEFNCDLIEFNLILRMGLNFGDVTAGVIGTTKLYYDIWGDAVNIASRMDTTGVDGRIQVSQACVSVLRERYDFEARGEVYVKGKDHMELYLLKGRRTAERDSC